MKKSSPFAPTKRMYPLRPHAVQQALWTTANRFVTVPAGRRSGKTELAKRKLVREAYASLLAPHAKWDVRYFFAAAPVRDQAKRIYWNDLKSMINPKLMDKKPSESELKIYLRYKAQYVEIHVVGLDKPERIEGSPWDGGVLDEYGNMKAAAWGANVRPALSDRQGWCWLIGVPEGRNHYYEMDCKARADTTGVWGSFHWKSADILPPEEIEMAKADLDPLTYQQEYEADFVHFSGRAYYSFEDRYNCNKNLRYDPAQPLAFCFDFNVAPGVAVVCQEQFLPGQYEWKAAEGSTILRKQQVFGTGCIGEVNIPRNSNTPAVVRRLIKEWGNHSGLVYCYGDATGGAQGTAKLDGSDWELIKSMLRAKFQDRVIFKVPTSNPTERARVNAVNSRCKTQNNTIRLMVDPGKCPSLVKDFEGVRVLEGGSGEIDKKADPKLTHWTDALGYYIAREFPVQQREVYDIELLNRF